MPPVVPTIRPQVAAAGPQRIRQNPDAPIEAFGGQSADNFNRQNNALGGLVNTVSRIYEVEQGKADDARTKEAYASLVDAKNELYWGKQGAVNRKGADAADVTTTYGEQFKKTADEIRKNLSNDSQRGAFDEMYRKEDTEFNGMLLRHASTENQNYQRQTTEAVVASSMNDAVQNYALPNKVEESVQLQRNALGSYLAQNGADEKTIQLEVGKAVSNTYASVIGRMLSLGEDKKASEYFAQVKGNIESGETLTRLEKALEEGSIRGESQRQTQMIVGKSKDMSQAIAEARKIDDPKLQDEVVRRVKDEYALKESAQRQGQEQLFEGVMAGIEQNPSKDAIAPQTWLAMTPQQRVAAETRIRQVREGIQPVTEWTKYYDVKELAQNAATRDQFLKMDLMELRPKMADVEFKELVNIQAGLRKGDAKTQKLMDGYRSDDQVVNSVILSMGMNPKPRSVGEQNRIASFKRAVDDKVQAYQLQTGKKVTNTELQGIADELAVQVVTERGMLWDTKKRVYELAPGEAFELADVRSVPSSEVLKIQQALRNKGKPISDEAVVNVYRQKILGAKTGAIK
jgi:hypothetical protein